MLEEAGVPLCSAVVYSVSSRGRTSGVSCIFLYSIPSELGAESMLILHTLSCISAIVTGAEIGLSRIDLPDGSMSKLTMFFSYVFLKCSIVSFTVH